MSIINDALKKAKKNKQLFQNEPFQILSKRDEEKTGKGRFVLKRWLFFSGAGIICFWGVTLAINSFKSSTSTVSILETIPATETPQSAFRLREIDVETPLSSSDFHLSGILYDEQKPLAIINDRIVREGAFINGAELLEIQHNHVRFSLREKEFRLKIK